MIATLAIGKIHSLSAWEATRVAQPRA